MMTIERLGLDAQALPSIAYRVVVDCTLFTIDGFAAENCNSLSVEPVRIQWPDPRCIICCNEQPLSSEHIIPKSIGGILECDFLCTNCNSKFGSSFEANAKKSPEFRKAAQKLNDKAPKLHEFIEEGQRYIVIGGAGELQAVRRSGVIETRPRRLEDGSLIYPIDGASEHIEQILRKNSATSAEVREAHSLIRSAPADQPVDLPHDFVFTNWRATTARPDYSNADPADDLLILKIAFEYFALLAGRGIFHEPSPIDEIRNILSSQQFDERRARIERKIANEPHPIHGLCLEGNKPHAIIQIRLFGTLAYLVHFLSLSISSPNFIYTQDLSEFPSPDADGLDVLETVYP